MRDALGPGTTLGYCTNVHAGTTLDAVKQNLETFACAVRDRVAPGGALGIGLWLAAPAARSLRAAGDGVPAFRDWLDERGLHVFTINGFPYDDFHRDVVKHRVYQPSWADERRLGYTIDLMHILAELLPPGAEGSISTLPLGWRAEFDGDGRAAKTAGPLARAAGVASDIERDCGRLIHLDLEPEPMCAFERAADVIRYYEANLLGGADEDTLRRHLRVCHDVCHAAVIFEDQVDELRAYAGAGIAVGKVQISSAVRAPFETMNAADAAAAAGELATFGEIRYLHQTAVRRGPGEPPEMYEDLPDALRLEPAAGEWRVHYHVPVFLDEVGRLGTTRDEIAPCLAEARFQGVRHFEVETYAWSVLPAALRTGGLVDGIARELEWVRGLA